MRLSLGVTVVWCLAAAACGEVKNDGDDDGGGGGEPGAPTAVTATANVDLGARVSWTAPAGATVDSYTVTASPAGGTVKIAGTQAVVSGLTAGTAYTFTVTATNANGTSPASEASGSVTIVAGPAAPGKLIACGADGITRLSATGTTGVAGFNIYFGSATGVSKLAETKATSATLPYVHEGRTNGQKTFYVVTAVDAAGVESADSAEDSATADSAIHDSVFVGSYRVNAIEIVDCASRYATGDMPPARKLTNGPLGANYNNLVLDAGRGFIYHRNPTAILVYNTGTKVDGTAAPVRTISSTALASGRGIALDTQRDLLYVFENASASILVFPNASTANGAVNPLHTITGLGTVGGGMFIDMASDRLYFANHTDIQVFNGASAANGAAAPARTITLNGITLSSFSVSVDTGNDTLYIASRNTGAVYSVQASTANGAVTPLRTLSGLNTPMTVIVAQNRLYTIADNNGTTVTVWNNASTVDGAVAPSAIVKLPTMNQTGSLAYAP